MLKICSHFLQKVLCSRGHARSFLFLTPDRLLGFSKSCPPDAMPAGPFLLFKINCSDSAFTIFQAFIHVCVIFSFGMNKHDNSTSWTRNSEQKHGCAAILAKSHDNGVPLSEELSRICDTVIFFEGSRNSELLFTGSSRPSGSSGNRVRPGRTDPGFPRRGAGWG